jgi:hypothetical protein
LTFAGLVRVKSRKIVESRRSRHLRTEILGSWDNPASLFL